MSNLTANNLSVSGNITCNSILSSSNIQTSANLICNDLIVNGTGNLLSFNNLDISGTINNTITTTNLLSLDTNSSIQTSLNSINGNISSIQTQQQTDINSINTLNTEMNNLNSHYKYSGNFGYTNFDTSGNFTISNNSGQELILSNGTLNLTNVDTSAEMQFQITDLTTGNKVYFSPINNNGGDYNSIAPSNCSIIGCYQPLCIFQQGSAPSGLILSQNYVMLGSGVVTGTNIPSNYIYIDSSGIGFNKQTPNYTLDINGNINTNTGLYLDDTITQQVKINFGTYTDGLAPSYSCNKIDLYNQQKNYGFGIASNTLIYNSLQNHSFYSGSTNTNIGTQIMNIDLSGVIISNNLIVNNNNILNSINSLQTQQTTNINNISLVQNYINSISNNVKNISGNIELISSNSSSNYIYISGSGIGINKNSGIANTIDVNGDISITNGSIGSIGSYLFNLNNNLTNLTNQLNTLISHSAKAYGYYNLATNNITNSYNIKTSLPIAYGAVQNNITGILIVLENFVPAPGICIATPDSGGYCCQTNYDGSTGSFIVGVQNGGSAPYYIQSSFNFVIY